MNCYSKVALFVGGIVLFLFIGVSSCEALSFTSQNFGGTTFYTGGISGSSQNLGGTRFYSVGNSSFTSQDLGGTTFYSGDVSGSSQNLGGTRFYSVGDLNFTSQDLGGTTFYTGDISGSSYNLEGTTYSQTNINESVRRPVPVPTYSYSPSYYPSYGSSSPYLLRLYQLNLYSKVLSELQKTQPKVQTQTYGGQNGEPTFTSKEAYDMWKQVHEHPTETLSSWLDKDAVEDQQKLGGKGVPNISNITVLGGGKVRLTWNGISDATKYYVFYGPSSGGYIYQTPTTSLTFEIGGLPAGQRYYFAIQAEINGNVSNNQGGYTQKGKEASIVVQ